MYINGSIIKLQFLLALPYGLKHLRERRVIELVCQKRKFVSANSVSFFMYLTVCFLTTTSVEQCTSIYLSVYHDKYLHLLDVINFKSNTAHVTHSQPKFMTFLENIYI